MATQAKVTSIEALETFRAQLILFISRAHRATDETLDEVRRTRVWLQTEQRTHWDHQLKKRRKILDQAEQDLLSAKLSALRDNIAPQQVAVIKAKRAVAEAEEKVRTVKIWNRDFESTVEPLAKRLEMLRQFLDYDLPKGLSFLVQAQKTLEAYAETSMPKTHTNPNPEEPTE